ncbi:MAG: hypothetical protein AB7U98_12125 [Candidatus Nitrosocosmicus sp.]
MTKRILVLNITNEKVHTGKLLMKLINQLLDGSMTTTATATTNNNGESTRR